MKKILVFSLAIIVTLIFTVQVQASNSVKITGDILKNQCLTIDVNWTADTANSKGMQLRQSREKMYDKMWEKILPKLVEKTKGYPMSFDHSQFILVSEKTQLQNERSNGTFVYNVKLKLKFACGRTSGQTGVTTQTYTEKQLDDEFKYRFQAVVR